MKQSEKDARRARRVDLEQREFQSRCHHCKAAMVGRAIQQLGDPTRFCSENCFMAALELKRMFEASR